MPDCQSGAVHSLVCGTIIYSAVAGDMGVCHSDCHEGIAAKPCAIRAAAVVEVPVSFQKKETGTGWRKIQQADTESVSQYTLPINVTSSGQVLDLGKGDLPVL
jgi:hypothetical protein